MLNILKNGWVKSLRLPIVFMAGALTLVSFRISHWDNIAFIIAIFIIAVASAIMAHNDWRDRFHDLKKGKDFALIKSNSFLKFVIFLWIISLCLATALLITNIYFGLLSFTIIVAGLIYSETRRIPFLPTIIVAITSASPVIYSIVLESSKSLWFLFIASALLIFSSEIIKDLSDIKNDLGYKRTLPIIIGVNRSKIVAGVIIIFAQIIALNISPYTLIGAPLFLISLFYLITSGNYKVIEKTLDCAMAIILIVLFI